ncbi:hypothetical protein ES692_08370 [Psychroserpens burtonensis]|uniref:DUF6705 domain-containing protein n=1 Tax=Psychroserpens burtonensis TaxID=49278 RepID=A0A5C7BGS5_9FLAO|nr:DUF6705 family protein [Psychroserpens burtonensis]TXE17901.1 hypothetical protein ES692_08370 [Psychroserpens burtonensis]
MKSILILFIALISITASSQVVEICSSEIDDDDAVIGTYFKDINNTFTPFLGTWQSINGNEIITFKIEKITHFYNTETQMYEDFLIGNYNYSQDGGTTNIIHTINPFASLETPTGNAMYSSCVLYPNAKFSMTFYDVLLDKGFGLITFEFLPGSTTQMQATLANEQGAYGYFVGEPEPNFNFSIPTSFVVTKL